MKLAFIARILRNVRSARRCWFYPMPINLRIETPRFPLIEMKKILNSIILLKISIRNKP